MSVWSWLVNGPAETSARRLEAAGEATAVPPGERALAAAAAARFATGVSYETVRLARREAMALSVVNRSRDLLAGVLASCPLRRVRTRAGRTEDLGPGWLERPDPTRTRGAFVADVVDDLFFHGYAVARVTARYAGGDVDGYPAAMQRVPWGEARYDRGEGEWTWIPGDGTSVVRFRDVDAVLFESPLTGVLEHPGALVIARRLDRAAYRFAASTVPLGWLKQTGGEPLTPAEMTEQAQAFAAARDDDAVAFLNEWLDYHEATLDPDRMQLVDSRSYQDAAAARVCNVPNYSVGVSVPGDSMTYKTAQTARLDLVDFALAPYVSCLEQTLSGPDVTPTGTSVVVDLEPFLRSSAWATTGPSTAVPANTPEVPA